jgi:hypothetical protein
MRRPTTWLMGLTAAVALVLLLLGFLVVPRLLHPPLSPVELQRVASVEKRLELRQAQDRLQADARATLLQGVAGLLLVIGVIATWRQVRVTREGQITERFARAVDHLGSDKPDVRLGGIYTLERIAKDSPPDRRTVVAVLGAFVRNHVPWLVDAPGGPEHPTPTVDEQMSWLQYRAADVQAAMTVLGRRLPSRDPVDLFLSRIDLRGVHLVGAQLSNAAFRHSNLARSAMDRVNLEASDLGDADLRRAWLVHARLKGANLSQAHLQDADLRGADLQNANLQGAHLQGADLSGANLQGARLDKADLTNVRYDAATLWPAGFQPS